MLSVCCLPLTFESDGYGASVQRDHACYDEQRTVVVKIVDRWVLAGGAPFACVHAHIYSCQACMHA